MRFWRANCNAPMPSATRQSADGRRLGAYLIEKSTPQKKTQFYCVGRKRALGGDFRPKCKNALRGRSQWAATTFANGLWIRRSAGESVDFPPDTPL